MTRAQLINLRKVKGTHQVRGLPVGHEVSGVPLLVESHVVPWGAHELGLREPELLGGVVSSFRIEDAVVSDERTEDGRVALQPVNLHRSR